MEYHWSTSLEHSPRSIPTRAFIGSALERSDFDVFCMLILLYTFISHSCSFRSTPGSPCPRTPVPNHRYSPPKTQYDSRCCCVAIGDPEPPGCCISPGGGPSPNFTVFGTGLNVRHAWAGVGGTPRGSSSTCVPRDICPTLTDQKYFPWRRHVSLKLMSMLR